MVLPSSSRAFSTLVGIWSPPLVAPSSPSQSSPLADRKPTPIPPKRTFTGPALASSSNEATGVNSSLSATLPSPLQSTRQSLTLSPYSRLDSASYRLAVPASTPASLVSPQCSPLLNVRKCLPLSGSPMSDCRALPVAPPTSPAVDVLDRLFRSAAFKNLIKQQARQTENSNGGAKEEKTVDSDSVTLNFASSDEKRRSLSGGRGMEWMPVLVE